MISSNVLLGVSYSTTDRKVLWRNVFTKKYSFEDFRSFPFFCDSSSKVLIFFVKSHRSFLYLCHLTIFFPIPFKNPSFLLEAGQILRSEKVWMDSNSVTKKSQKYTICPLFFFLLFSLESLLETEVGQYLRGPCFRFNECDVGLWSPFMWFSSFAILTSAFSLWPFYSTNFTWFRKTFIYWSFKLCCYFQAVLLWWFNNFTWVSTRN